MKKHRKWSGTIFNLLACGITFGVFEKKPILALFMFVVLEIICIVMDALFGRTQWDEEREDEQCDECDK